MSNGLFEQVTYFGEHLGARVTILELVIEPLELKQLDGNRRPSAVASNALQSLMNSPSPNSCIMHPKRGNESLPNIENSPSIRRLSLSKQGWSSCWIVAMERSHLEDSQ